MTEPMPARWLNGIAEDMFQLDPANVDREIRKDNYMEDQDEVIQQKLHEAIEEALANVDEIEEGHILASWVICYEVTSLGSTSSQAGHFYGPREMTSWRALGLIEWIRRFSLRPGEEDE